LTKRTSEVLTDKAKNIRPLIRQERGFRGASGVGRPLGLTDKSLVINLRNSPGAGPSPVERRWTNLLSWGLKREYTPRDRLGIEKKPSKPGGRNRKDRCRIFPQFGLKWVKVQHISGIGGTSTSPVERKGNHLSSYTPSEKSANNYLLNITTIRQKEGRT